MAETAKEIDVLLDEQSCEIIQKLDELEIKIIRKIAKIENKRFIRKGKKERKSILQLNAGRLAIYEIGYVAGEKGFSLDYNINLYSKVEERLAGQDFLFSIHKDLRDSLYEGDNDGNYHRTDKPGFNLILNNNSDFESIDEIPSNVIESRDQYETIIQGIRWNIRMWKLLLSVDALKCVLYLPKPEMTIFSQFPPSPN